MLKRKLFVLSLSVAFLFSCKKENIYVEGNVAPPDPTVETVTKENYVNKLYISLLGRKADSTEFNAGMAILNKNDLSVSDRNELLDIILTKDEFYDNQFKVDAEIMVNGADEEDFDESIAILEFSKTLTNDAGVIAFYDSEITKLTKLKNAIDELKSGSIKLKEVHKRLGYNNIYDEINMGTENFVVSMFQNLLSRYPTTEELNSGKTMVDGGQSIIFLQTGGNKEDFVDAFISSPEYYEGQIRALYQRFIFKEPSSEQMSSLGASYKSDDDYKKLLKSILSTDEYAGVK